MPKVPNLYPTVEVIDRTYPPPGLATRYPIQIDLDQDDFDAALAGQMVTRVVFLEDPQTATPMEQTAETTRPLEVSHESRCPRSGRPIRPTGGHRADRIDVTTADGGTAASVLLGLPGLGTHLSTRASGTAMRRSSGKIVLLASSLTLVAAGCAITGRRPGQRSAHARCPGDTQDAVGRATLTNARYRLDLAAARLLDDDAIHPRVAVRCAEQQSVAQVGCFTPAQCRRMPPAACHAVATAAEEPLARRTVTRCRRPRDGTRTGSIRKSFFAMAATATRKPCCAATTRWPACDPEDTVVHYTTEAGDIGIQASNRTCLYAPRFASVRKITGAVAGDHAIGAAQFDRPLGASGIDQPLPGLVMTDTIELAHADVARRIDAMRERIRGVPVDSVFCNSSRPAM